MLARDRLRELIGGYRVSQMVRAAALLGIAEQLAAGPLEAGTVASRVGVDSGLLRRLLRALTACGVFVEHGDGRFSNSELGDLLIGEVAGGLRGVAIGLTDDPWWLAWGQFPAGVRDGGQPFLLAHGKSFWQMLQADPVAKARFNGFMVAQTEAFVPQLLEAFDFSGCAKVLDVGGGNGALVAGVLKAHAAARATVFDLEAGLDGADAYLRRQGVRERCELASGSFLDSVPEGADAYFLRLVLHDWEDEQAAAILATCRRAMRPGAWLLVIEHLLPRIAQDAPIDRQSLILDMHMHVVFGTHERTEDELRALLDGAGFRVDRVAPTTPTATIVARADRAQSA